MSHVLKFATEDKRDLEISKLRRDGYNYFVCYENDEAKFVLQFAKSTSNWVKKNMKCGAWISGKILCFFVFRAMFLVF